MLTIGLEQTVVLVFTSKIMDMVYVVHKLKATLTVIFQHMQQDVAVGQDMVLIENGLSCHLVLVTVTTSVFTILTAAGYGIGMVLIQILD